MSQRSLLVAPREGWRRFWIGQQAIHGPHPAGVGPTRVCQRAGAFSGRWARRAAAQRCARRALFQPEVTQEVEESVGDGGEPEPQLVGAQGVGAGPVGEQVQLLLLDAVLHVATGAVQLFVEVHAHPGISPKRGWQRGWVFGHVQRECPRRLLPLHVRLPHGARSQAAPSASPHRDPPARPHSHYRRSSQAGANARRTTPSIHGARSRASDIRIRVRTLGIISPVPCAHTPWGECRGHRLRLPGGSPRWNLHR